MGRVLIAGASPGLTGAVVLAAGAALRSGAGMVTCAVPAALDPIVEAAKPAEAMTLPLPDRGLGIAAPDAIPLLAERLPAFDAVLIGPGLGRAKESAAFFAALMALVAGAHVIDADGLWHLAGARALLERGHHLRVLTPHTGEMRRLLAAIGAPETPRAECARGFAARIPGTLVLKGPHTLIADSGTCHENPTGNPGMATAGAGDVLAGMIAAMLARGDRPLAAASRAVYLHGRAGDLARDRFGEESLIASDITAALPDAIRELQESGR